MLTYLLILFVVALALAPLAHFVPSKHQRRVSRLREYAAVHGLFVEFRSLPGGDRVASGLGGGARRDVIYYGKRLSAAASERVSAGRWVRGEEGWRSLDHRAPVPPSLLGLPPDILAASIDISSCGIYWIESADEAVVEQIRQALECWSAELFD